MTDQSRGTRRFHHVGLRAMEPQPGENFVAATRVWVTDPNAHPQRIEYLRYEPDSYLDDRFKDTPHVAWVVDDIGPWIAGREIAIAPFEVGEPPFSRVAFVWEDGMISEYMAFLPGAVWFADDDAGTRRATGSSS
ncbi:MAG: hypothetical protein M3Z20_17430 [Chloroflexota bacterium]|nr:hypothetical protein [Chloroflexota bacterium]